MTPAHDRQEWIKYYSSYSRRLDDRINRKKHWQNRLKDDAEIFGEIAGAGLMEVDRKYIKMLDDCIIETQAKIQAIEAAVNAVDNEEYRQILKYRYFYNMKWQEIAAKMFLSPSTVQRMHNKAIDMVEIPESETE